MNDHGFQAQVTRIATSGPVPEGPRIGTIPCGQQDSAPRIHAEPITTSPSRIWKEREVAIVHHRDATVRGQRLFYREAGPPKRSLA